MSDPSRSELLPCPFCGSAASFSQYQDKLGRVITHIECANDDHCEVSCDVSHTDEAVAIKAWNTRTAQAATSVQGEAVAWRCFFCDEIFTDPKAAAGHFGETTCAEPLCKLAQIDGGIAKVVADLADALHRFQIEDNASFREFYALGADHRAALIREEQKGYDRGLADGRALSPVRQGAVETNIGTYIDDNTEDL